MGHGKHRERSLVREAGARSLVTSVIAKSPAQESVFYLQASGKLLKDFK